MYFFRSCRGERCEAALRKELDIERDEQTKKMYRSIIGGYW